MIDILLLATLLEGPKHGYQLKKEAGLMLGESDLHNNLVYPFLRRFREQGLVTRKSLPGERGQTRQQYQLTTAGKRTVLGRLGSFNEKQAQSGEEFLLRVGFFDALDPDACNHILSEREKILRARQQQFSHLGKEMDLGVYGGDVVGLLQQRIRGELRWIAQLRRKTASRERKKL